MLTFESGLIDVEREVHGRGKLGPSNRGGERHDSEAETRVVRYSSVIPEPGANTSDQTANVKPAPGSSELYWGKSWEPAQESVIKY